jgi:hypothetical protein
MKREAYLFPRVAEAVYPAFRDLFPGDAPDTHAGWLALMKRRHYVEMFHGYDVKEVDVDPDAYARFCADRGYAHDFESLGAFIAQVEGDGTVD